MSPWAFAILLLSSCQLVRVTSYRLAMHPDYVRISPDPQSVSFTCNVEVPLAGCQFKLWYYGGRAGPLMDLSLGSESQANSTHLDTGLTGYSYTGRGLDAGDCGISLQLQKEKYWITACRVRTETGGWTYAWSDLDADRYAPFPHTLTPRESVVLPGGEARFSLKTRQPLGHCYFYPPGLYLDFVLGDRSWDSTGRHRYLGVGLWAGECGLTLSNVSEADNGPVKSWIQDKEGTKDEHRFMALIVAERPTGPSLTVVQDNNSLNATCAVESSRPLPQMTWILGDDVIRQNTLDDSPGDPRDEWRWPWMKGSLTQKITVGLKPKDNGKILKCLVSHAALDQSLEMSETITITTTCPPLTSNTTAISCFSGGQEVNCSRPQPIGAWAEVSCKPGYVAVDDNTNSRINCTDLGEWDQPAFACQLDCGRRRTNRGQPHIYGGEESRVGEFPWHVAVYEGNNVDIKGSRRVIYQQICGGSLISTSVVLSAAHCFWSELYDRKKDSVYKVAAGKHKRAWLDAEDNDQVQRRRVEVVTLHPRYHGRQSSFQADIALMRLSAPVDLTVNVNLVCVDWGNLWEAAQLQHGNKGTIAGWGYTEQDGLSPVLKHVELPFVDHDTCYNALDESLKPLFTYDKFCAGYANSSISTCRGDSGGGLVFLRQSTNQYYLRGLLSIAFRPASSDDLCYAQLYTAFTLLSGYREWMRNQGV